jgi:hypothetical protein
MATLEAKFEAKRWPVGASKPDISPASFCAWLEKQRGAYDVNHLRWCAIAQWLRAMGMNESQIADESFGLGQVEPFLTIAIVQPYTFEAASERARKWRR